MVFSRENFTRSLHALGIYTKHDVFPALSAAYSSLERHYHTHKHVAECLLALARHIDLAAQPAEVAIALWFHDAIYDTHRSDNEECSAGWAYNFLLQEGLDSETATRIYLTILATKHDAVTTKPDEQLLVDIDLAILGQDRATFAEYDAAIRREYHWVPEHEYRSGRAAVLRAFLSRKRIYSTQRFYSLYERQARLNLENALHAFEKARNSNR